MTAEIPTNDKDQKVLAVSCTLGMKSAIYIALFDLCLMHFNAPWFMNLVVDEEKLR